MIRIKFIFFSIIIVMHAITQIYCYTYLEPQLIGEGDCFDDEWEVHPVGTVWYDTTRCERLECAFYDGILYVEGFGCSAIGHPKECRLISGKGKNYPHCCPQVECPEGIIW